MIFAFRSIEPSRWHTGSLAGIAAWMCKALRLAPKEADESAIRPDACGANCLRVVRGGNMQRSIQTTVPFFAVISMFAMLSTSLGCAFGEVYWTDPLKREYSLGEVQKRYTNLVRFGAFVQASKFVDPAIAESFISNFPDQADLVFTDFESGRIQFQEDSGRKDAIVMVNYSAYYTHSPIVFRIVETQSWYRDGPGNSWRVRPHFEGLKEFAAAN